MNLLERPDSTHLEAAQGWLDLGSHLEANEELERTSPENRTHPNVLQVRWRLCAKAEQWDACLDIATALTQLTLDRRFGWLHRAVSLRKLNRTVEARDVLLSVVDEFEANTTFPYYLACYCAQLGQIAEAKVWLEKAFACAASDEARDSPPCAGAVGRDVPTAPLAAKDRESSETGMRRAAAVRKAGTSGVGREAARRSLTRAPALLHRSAARTTSKGTAALWRTTSIVLPKIRSPMSR
jgi:hypothetical protein